MSLEIRHRNPEKVDFDLFRGRREHAHSRGTTAVEEIGSHDRAMFCEDIRRVVRPYGVQWRGLLFTLRSKYKSFTEFTLSVAEFTLSLELRSFTSFRMTGEGLA